jgi:transglutaminase-like putative cysteine protease
MAQLARAAASDPEFRAVAHQFSSMNAVEAWVRENYSYRDENEEIVRTPQFMLADMGRSESGRVVQLEGDCDDVATLFAAFGKALGLYTRLTAIRYTADNPEFEHVFTEVYDGGKWRAFDATVPAGTNLQWLESMTEDI